MNRFQFTTRLIILILWVGALVYMLVVGAFGGGMLCPLGQVEDRPEPTRSYQFFFVAPAGAIAFVVGFVVFAVLGRRTLRLAFCELSYPQFSLLTLGMILFLYALANPPPLLHVLTVFTSWLMPDMIFWDWPLHELAYVAGLNMLTVFVPAGVAVIGIGWPWRYIARTGLISATAACLTYILWCYLSAAVVWRGSWMVGS